MFTYLLLWFPMLLIAIGNGLLRELYLKKYFAELRAHQLSTLTLLFFFSIYIYFVIKHFTPSSSSKALLIGIVWITMTLAFEFGFGRWRGNSWEKLLEDYNLLAGRWWIFVPFWVALAPYVFYKLLT